MAPRTRISSASGRLSVGLLVALCGLGLGDVGCLNPRPDVQPSVEGDPDGPALVPGDSSNPSVDGPDGDHVDDTPNEGQVPEPAAPAEPGEDDPPPVDGEPRPADAGPDAGADAG